MATWFSPRYEDKPRWVLAAVLGLIALALIGGGIELATLGGSLYYVIAGIVVAGSAYFVARGDSRGRCLYLAMLIGTAIWALIEVGGSDGWGLQARIFAPAVLGLWVFWPWFRQYPPVFAAIVLAGLGGLVWLFVFANAVEKPSASAGTFESGSGEWLQYGNDVGGTRYSPLGKITPDNVGDLKEAWRVQTGHDTKVLGFEVTPLFIKDTLYICTPQDVVIAYDPDTGERRWTFDPKADIPQAAVCRGLAYYAVPNATGPCAERIIFGTVDGRLIAVDRIDGKLCQDFGTNGEVDAKKGLGPYIRGYWRINSAPVIVHGKAIIGGWVADNEEVGEPSGVIRAYDAVTGKFVWAWDMEKPGVHTELPEGETYTKGTPNSWPPLSGDEALGLAFIPMGNATPDYWGGERTPLEEKFSSAIVALDVETGEPRWSYQTTHHDLWDYDIASQPTAVDLPINGETVPALMVPTKRGQTFMLDRRDGKLLAKVEERPVPQGPAEGDWLSPTQPFSTEIPAFDETVWSERTMWGMTPLDQLWCRIKFREARYEGPFTPPGPHPTITYPSYQGGSDWGSVAVDPERRLMVVNWTRLPNYTKLIPRKVADAMGVHVDPNGAMHTMGLPEPQMGTPFALSTKAFLSPLDIPCSEPPFGKITVVNLDTRKTVWERPLGTTRDNGPFGIASHIPLPMGVPNTGGAVTTKSGVIFIAAAQENAIRAFDIRDGRKLWESRLPAGGQATPMTFISPKTGKQYVVIAVGGNFAISTKMGDYVIAYTLP
jgi:membrane-bound PQQ-dependent dehydrogenase (glucose/quinate/shikimate family)